MATGADTESGIEQETHYQGLEDTPDVDIEFGGLGAVAVGASFWGKLQGMFKAAAKGAASSGMIKDALNDYSPGLGDAAQKGMQLVEAGNAGDATALAQLAAIARGAAAGDPAKVKANDMLQAIAAARRAAVVEVGRTYVVRDPKTGKKKKFKSKAAADAWMRAQQQGAGARRPGQPQAQRKPQRPATTRDVQAAINRTPPQKRPQLVSMIQQAQAQGQYPLQPAPYWAQPGSPYGYGAPPMYQQPYGPAYYSEGYAEQAEYYGEPDEELEAAFAGDESFPDEGLQGEPQIAYQG